MNQPAPDGRSSSQSRAAPRRFTWKSRDGLTLSGMEWLPAADHTASPPLLCLPGLSRNTKDFQDLANYLQAEGQHVIALDYRGRGQSDWDDEWQNYSLPVEGHDIDDALAHLGLDRVSILGTSRGGLHAMAMAQRYDPGRIAKIILNDIGPHIEMKAIHRLAASIGKTMRFPDKAACAASLAAGLKNQFPALSPADWLRFADQLGATTPDGFVLEYDPALRKTLAVMDEGDQLPDLWPLFEILKPIPLLILHGAESDLLSEETCKRMLDVHGNARLLNIPDEGHAPLLWDERTWTTIAAFLKLQKDI